MLFLFPTRWEYKKTCSTKTTVVDDKKFEVIYDEIFTNNIMRMKDVAVGYYTESKLPKNLNESDKLTLGDMYDKHLILKVKDKNGKECNKEKSYSEIIKTNDGYKLKVNLSCGSQEEYVIFNLYDSNYCTRKTCEVTVNPTSQPSNNGGKVTEPVVQQPTQTQQVAQQTSQQQNQQSQQGQSQQQTTTKVSVTGITLSKTEVSLIVGSKITITATVKPSNATNKKYTWKSSNTNVATVQGGIITAVGVGTTNITVTTEDGGKVATVKVTVTKQQSQSQQGQSQQGQTIQPQQEVKPQQVAVTSITVNKTSVSIYVGDSTTVSATVAPSNATNKTVTWKSNNTNIATVSNGVIKGVKAGSTTVVATTSNGKTVTVNVTVKNKEQKVVKYQYSKQVPVYGSWSSKTTTPIKKTSTLDVYSWTEKVNKPITKEECNTVNQKIGSHVEEIPNKQKIGETDVVDHHTNETCPCNTCNTATKTFRNIVRNSDGTCNWEEVTHVNVYKTYYTEVTVDDYKEQKVCKNVTKDNYVDVTYYKSRTISYKPDYKWSTSANDTSFINQGYKYTGVTQ